MRYAVLVALGLLVGCTGPALAEDDDKDTSDPTREETFEELAKDMKELQREYMKALCEAAPSHPACGEWRGQPDK